MNKLKLTTQKLKNLSCNNKVLDKAMTPNIAGATLAQGNYSQNELCLQKKTRVFN